MGTLATRYRYVIVGAGRAGLSAADLGPLRVIVVGGGFVGSEMAAALSEGGHQIDWIVPEKEPFERIFPATLRARLFSAYQDHGVEIITGTRVESIEQSGNRPVVVASAKSPTASRYCRDWRWLGTEYENYRDSELGGNSCARSISGCLRPHRG